MESSPNCIIYITISTYRLVCPLAPLNPNSKNKGRQTKDCLFKSEYKINKYFQIFFQPVLVTLSSKTDPLWRDYEQQCLTSSDNSSGSTVAHILPTTYGI